MESLNHFGDQSANLQLLKDFLLTELGVDDLVEFEILLGTSRLLRLVDSKQITKKLDIIPTNSTDHVYLSSLTL